MLVEDLASFASASLSIASTHRFLLSCQTSATASTNEPFKRGEGRCVLTWKKDSASRAECFRMARWIAKGLRNPWYAFHRSPKKGLRQIPEGFRHSNIFLARMSRLGTCNFREKEKSFNTQEPGPARANLSRAASASLPLLRARKKHGARLARRSDSSRPSFSSGIL